MKIKLILSILCVLFLYADYATAQIRKPSPSPTPFKEPSLTPLTEAERALDLQSIVANQPDFIADESFFYNEGFGGFSATSRIARKGNRYLIDTGFVKIIVEPDKEIRLDDDDKTFEETPIRKDFIVGSGQPINPQSLASQKGVKFVALGTQIIDGHKCLKIEAKLEGESSQIFIYAAEDLKYLIIAVQVLTPPRSSVQKLQNISLEVPSRFVEVPRDYKPIPKYKWARLNSAKVTLNGKPPEISLGSQKKWKLQATAFTSPIEIVIVKTENVRKQSSVITLCSFRQPMKGQQYALNGDNKARRTNQWTRAATACLLSRLSVSPPRHLNRSTASLILLNLFWIKI
jgi:hypothetical protein